MEKPATSEQEKRFNKILNKIIFSNIIDDKNNVFITFKYKDDKYAFCHDKLLAQKMKVKKYLRLHKVKSINSLNIEGTLTILESDIVVASAKKELIFQLFILKDYEI